jgi:hypothetical protein
MYDAPASIQARAVLMYNSMGVLSLAITSM